MTFEQLNIESHTAKKLEQSGITTPTKIQTATIPAVLDGKDVLAQSATGSGKTLAFLLPIFQKIQKGIGIQALIITPTRELAKQIAEEADKFSSYNTVAVYGGAAIGPQERAVPNAEIIVGTPGRILDLMERRSLKFSRLKFLVLDEADRMLSMGFIEDVERIMSGCPENRQTLLFSATIPEQIERLSRKYLKSPVNLFGQRVVMRTKLEQKYYDVDQKKKFSLLVHLLHKMERELVLIFCSTKVMTDRLAFALKKSGFNSECIHGGITQARREKVMQLFAKGEVQILVATDVAARGLHINNISHVINYDVPNDPENYVHRIGRTARAGESGEAILLLTPPDYQNFEPIYSKYEKDIQCAEMPMFRSIPFPLKQRNGRFGGGNGRFGNGDRRRFSGPPRRRWN